MTSRIASRTYLPRSRSDRTGRRRLLPLPGRLSAVLALSAVAAAGCSNGFQAIDERVDRLLASTSEDLGPETQPPRTDRIRTERTPPDWQRDPTRTDLLTENPDSQDLSFRPMDEAADVIERLERYAEVPEETVRMTLSEALQYSINYSREFRFAEEEYMLAALRLLIERHRWGPRFFNEIQADITSDGDGGSFDTALRLVNEFRMTQRLPYGGEVSARALVRATENLHNKVAGQDTQSAEVILQADIPLLRGAGMIAREDRIQLERDLIYAARRFERFRREFLFDIANDFLSLVVQQQGIENARRGLESREWLEDRSRELVRAGRETPIDLALAEQDTLFARDSLNRQIESYRLAVNRFKIRIGMPEVEPLEIVPSDLGLPTPEVSLDQAVASAMRYRLDLQTRRDQLDDARRGKLNAQNLLLPDLDLTGRVSVPTDPDRDRGGVDLSPGDASALVGITFGLPLDREIERVNVRQAQISLERAIRDYNRFRDDLAVTVRGVVRDIDRATFSLQIQEENVAIAERRMEAIEAAPDRATARDRSEAVDGLLRAQDERDSARRDLQIFILRYLLQTGQLRVGPDGHILPLAGMEIAEAEALDGR